MAAKYDLGLKGVGVVVSRLFLEVLTVKSKGYKAADAAAAAAISDSVSESCSWSIKLFWWFEGDRDRGVFEPDRALGEEAE
jgi:hypothetical protein